MIAAVISALAAIIVSAVTIFLTKQKEREAIWRAKKLAYYEEFFAACSGIVGSEPPNEAKNRFATAVNTVHLIGSYGTLEALHRFCDEIADSNLNKSRERHDLLWSRLVWEIRADLGDPPTKSPTTFRALLWASGIKENMTYKSLDSTI